MSGCLYRKCQPQLCRFAGNTKDLRIILVSIILVLNTCCLFSPDHDSQTYRILRYLLSKSKDDELKLDRIPVV
ncbi:hypothetical protein T06_12864 [Trichinella sp. T6]|nr:hypothetical protein T06_12864 [Trichinella sp. T6]